MEKAYPPEESSPPYPGPPMNYGGVAPPQEMYPQPGFSTAAPQFVAHQTGLCLRWCFFFFDSIPVMFDFFSSMRPFYSIVHNHIKRCSNREEFNLNATLLCMVLLYIIFMEKLKCFGRWCKEIYIFWTFPSCFCKLRVLPHAPFAQPS